MSPDVFALDTLHDTLLIGPRSTFQRVVSAAASDVEVRRRLTRHKEQTGMVRALRDCCRGWGVPLSRPPDLTLHLVDRVVEAVACRHLVAYVLPPVLNLATFGADVVKAKGAIAPTGTVGSTSATTPDKEPARRQNLSPEQRVAEVVRRAEGHLPAARYAAVFEPTTFIKCVAVMALWLNAPIGITTHILAAVFRASAGRADSRRIGERTADVEALLDQIRVARDDMRFDQAAHRLARLIERFGADDFIRTMRVVPDKVRGGGTVKEGLCLSADAGDRAAHSAGVGEGQRSSGRSRRGSFRSAAEPRRKGRGGRRRDATCVTGERRLGRQRTGGGGSRRRIFGRWRSSGGRRRRRIFGRWRSGCRVGCLRGAWRSVVRRRRGGRSGNRWRSLRWNRCRRRFVG